ncbi:MAG: hypothetical protein K5894_01285, partial [Lachnospiraceae bacterium]|nr:hypothetical protein [Lachnospiraceae bacterium]
IKDIDSYFDQMIEAKESYKDMTDMEILLSDYKEYDMDGTMIAVASVEARGEERRADMAKRMLKEAETALKEKSLEHIYIMLNDGDNKITELLYCGEGADIVSEEAFTMDKDGNIIIDHIASRKKDIVPPLTDAYKALNGSWKVKKAA